MRVLWLSPWLRPLARANVEGLRALGVEVMLITAPLHPESDALREYEVELLGRPLPHKGGSRSSLRIRVQSDLSQMSS